MIEANAAGLQRYLKPSAPLGAALARLDAKRNAADGSSKHKRNRKRRAVRRK